MNKYEVHMFPEEVILKVKDILEVKIRKNLMEMNTQGKIPHYYQTWQAIAHSNIILIGRGTADQQTIVHLLDPFH